MVAQTIFVGMLIAWYALRYVPLIRRLDETIKRTRSMLFLVPDEVVEGVREIRKRIVAQSKL
jgi:hypothetical protein